MTDDDRNAAHEALQRLLEKLGESSGVLLDLRGYLEALDRYYSATAELLRRGRKLLIAAAIVGVGSAISLAVSAGQLRSIENSARSARASAAKVERIADRNTLAIRLGCQLIVDLINDAGVGETSSQSRVATLQRRLNGLLVRAITGRVLTVGERAQARRLARQIAAAGSLVATPDCEDISRYPARYIAALDPPAPTPMSGRRP